MSEISERHVALQAPTATLQVWSGRLFLWPGRAAYLGHAADTTVHAHHAVQLCVAIDGSFRLRGGPRSRWRLRSAALIPADREHQLDGRGALLALIYLDPEVDIGRQLATVCSASSFTLREDQVPQQTRDQLTSLARSDCGPEEAGLAIDAAISRILPEYVPCGSLDPRVARLVEHLAPQSGTPMPAADAAAFVGLSSHRFQHLFRASTGIPFRRYLLWLRLVAAVDHVASGGSLTNAAHAAGFSDSAHLSRTFRRMFGLSPSALARGSTFVQASTQSTS